MEEIKITDLSADYGTGRIFGPLSFTLRRGVPLVVMGKSGAGKTTLLRHMAGCDGAAPHPAIKDMRMGVMFQEDRLLPWLTLQDNVALVSDLPLREARERAREELTALGLEDKCDTLTSEASGGMKRRTAMARLMLFDPEIAFIDEAFNGVDAENGEKMLERLRIFCRDRFVLVITHDPSLCDKLGGELLTVEQECFT